MFFQFSSYVFPGAIFKYNLKDNTQTEYYTTQFEGIDLDNFIVEQIFYKSKDGTEIPMFVVHKKNSLITSSMVPLTTCCGLS